MDQFKSMYDANTMSFMKIKCDKWNLNFFSCKINQSIFLMKNVKVILPITNFFVVIHYYFQTTFMYKKIMRRICLLYLHVRSCPIKMIEILGMTLTNTWMKVPLIKYKFTVRDVFCFKWYIYLSEFEKKQMSRNFCYYNIL